MTQRDAVTKKTSGRPTKGQREISDQSDALVGAESRLEDARDRYAELFDCAPTPYLTLDEQGDITQCNLTAATLIGQPTQAIRGTPFDRLVPGDSRLRYRDYLRRCRSAGNDVREEFFLDTAGGPRCVQLLCRFKNVRGSSPEYLLALIDVTEERERAALASRLIELQDEERTRLARDLHDDIGQELTALRLMVELLASERSPAGVSAAIARLHRSLESLDRRLHFVASALRPAALDLGIAAALDDLIRQWSETFGVRVEFCSSGVLEGALAPEAETHLYRITQEALNNVSKHAGASTVGVLLERQDSDLVLEIRDDGCGFALDAPRSAGGGLGLLGMRERAQLIGAQLTVASREGKGTLVAVRMSFALVRRPPDRKQRP